MTNPYLTGSVAHREYAAGFACGMANAETGMYAISRSWSDAFSKGYRHGHAWGSR